jgi:glutaredoxin
MATVTLYSKPDCPLCDEARTALHEVARRRPFDLDEVDISSDPSLTARYGERIPVVAVDGEDLFDFVVDEAALESRLSSGAPVR